MKYSLMHKNICIVDVDIDPKNGRIIMLNALVDRLTYHSYVMNMNGRSYRLEKKLTKKREP